MIPMAKTLGSKNFNRMCKNSKLTETLLTVRKLSKEKLLLLFSFFSIGYLIELKVCEVSTFKNKKNIPIRYFLGHSQYQKKKALFSDPIFSDGFGECRLCWQMMMRADRRESRLFSVPAASCTQVSAEARLT
jgi:hypothetical protein